MGANKKIHKRVYKTTIMNVHEPADGIKSLLPQTTNLGDRGVSESPGCTKKTRVLTKNIASSTFARGPTIAHKISVRERRSGFGSVRARVLQLNAPAICAGDI